MCRHFSTLIPLFTATISHNNTEVWYSRLQEMIHLQQEQQIWMSEHKPEDNVNDDFLFPMGSRASYSPAQDTEPGNTPKTHPDDFDASPKHKKRLVRSSSDPSINTTDRVPGIPPLSSTPQLPQICEWAVRQSVLMPFVRMEAMVVWNLFEKKILISKLSADVQNYRL